MKKVLMSWTLMIGLVVTCYGQSYNDVLVIVNTNSSISKQIGNYFKTARSIPAKNICEIACSTNEQIDSTTFVSITDTIKSYMSTNNLTTSINYIVTTKGVPLKVKRFGSTASSWSSSSSFDSDLTMMNSDIESSIANRGGVANPYYGISTAFSRSSTYKNIYLVTRLTGYTYNDVKAMIDRAAQPYHSAGKFVFDKDPSKNSYLNSNMDAANNILVNKGYSTLLNSTTKFVVEEKNVLGYVSWGSNDSYWSSYTQRAQPHFEWSPKALAETYVSTSGRTFSDSNYVDPTVGAWQSLVADLIHENGVTGVKGYVYEPFSSAMAKVNILFDRWTAGRNLAESFYSASYLIGWMGVIVGDPKSTFAGNGHLPVELVSFSGKAAGDRIILKWRTATEINNYGFEVQKMGRDDWQPIGFVEGNGTVNTPQRYTFIDREPSPSNKYRLKQIDRDGTFKYSHVIVVENSEVADFRLGQNYPNPFNPSTVISYKLPDAATLTLNIYSVDGRLVNSLVNNEYFPAGQHSVVWNGRSAEGDPVASGIYLYHVAATTSDGRIWSDSRAMLLTR